MTTTPVPHANSNEESDIIIVDDHHDLNIEPTTPVASRAIAHDLSATGSTPEAAASLLPPATSTENGTAMLREWAPAANAAQLHPLSNISSPIPPVAPAVLLIQREESSNSASSHIDGSEARMSHSYQYPVATFVTNLVRSVSENVRSEIRDHIPHCQSRIQVQMDAPTLSYPRLQQASAMIPSAHVNRNESNETRIANNPVPMIPVHAALSNSDLTIPAIAAFEDDNIDLALVNGDIIAIPRHHEEELEESHRDVRSMGDISQDDDSDRQYSKSSRMQRGVRKKLSRLRRRIFTGGHTGGSNQKKSEKGRKNQRHLKQSEQAYGSNTLDDESDLRALREFRSNNLTDDDYESGDGDSVIEAPNRNVMEILSHPSVSNGVVDSTSNNNNFNVQAEENSTASSNKWHSEEFSIQTISMRSATSGHPSNLSPTGGKPKGHKKKTRFPRWLRGGTAESSSSNRSLISSGSSTGSSSLLKKIRHKQPPSSRGSSSPQRLKGFSTSMSLHDNHPGDRSKVDNLLPRGREGSLSTFSSLDQKPAAVDNLDDERRPMPPVQEGSLEFSSSSLHRLPLSSFAAQSPLHAPPIATAATDNLLGTPPQPSAVDGFQRSASIAAHASFVGHTDSITSQAGLLPASVTATEYYIEGRLDEYDKYDEKKSKFMKECGKVDREEPSIEVMLERAGEALEASKQDDAMIPDRSTLSKGKSTGESVPLSEAIPGDDLVHNDILKLVLVGDNAVDKSGLGRALRKLQPPRSKKRTTLRVDVHQWVPENSGLKFTMWEVQASKSEDPYLPNFGARPGTQSLFFSDRSLYLLVYDMGASNPNTFRQPHGIRHVDSDDEDSDDEFHHTNSNYALREEADRKANLALQADIEERVLSWVNCIARRGTLSAILPIALLPVNMSPEEANWRCQTMQAVIRRHDNKLPSNKLRPKILFGPETVVCVSLHNNMGLEDLERMILEIADPSHNIFQHVGVGTSIPPGTVEVMELCRRLKSKGKRKLILVDHLVSELPNTPTFSIESVMNILYFLASVGEVLYFGGSDSVLRHYVILSQKWLVSALSCILRNDLQRELSNTRQVMNMQSFYSVRHDQEFPESRVTQTFSGNNSSCPILSSQDTQMLWHSQTFMMEAVDRSSQLSEDSTGWSTMFRFLEHLLVHCGVFLPLEICSTENIYFIPSLLSQASSRDLWTYKSSEAWMTTLCHSWLFRDGVPTGLMEIVAVGLLRDLYEHSHARAERPNREVNSQSQEIDRQFHRAQTFPFGQSSMATFIESHHNEPIGQIKVHQINCWKNSLLVKVGRVFPKGNELFETITEIFVTVTDQVSPHNVACPPTMRTNMQRLVVSGKGEAGLHGLKIWKGGYNIVLDSIKASVANYTNTERQVVCPDCLASRPAYNASTWSWDSIRQASDDTIRCIAGHQADKHLICGTIPAISRGEDGSKIGNADKKPVKELLPATVLVGLWDNDKRAIINVGSGFIANKTLGFVITAAHILFDMEKGSNFGAQYKGLNNARAVVGVISSEEKNNTNAVFRYFAEIVAEDVHSMDACVLKITSRLENDVRDDSLIGEQGENVIENFQMESSSSLKMISHYEIEQVVRIIGFNQGGEGRLERGNHINKTSDFAIGYICKQFKPLYDHSTSSDDSTVSDEGVLQPREEIVVMCSTIEGHSGGPCVNNEGKVVGILSRVDPAERQRCYLVPSSELKTLVKKAKKRVGMRSSEPYR